MKSRRIRAHRWAGLLLSLAAGPALASGLGDSDGDNDIDLRDMAAFAVCFTGEGGLSSCAQFRFDTDPDVDLDDYAALQNTLLGPGVALPVVTDAAVIVGKVFHAVTGEPLPAAVVVAYYHPADQSQPPLPPFAMSDAQGNFAYTTVPVEGQATFVVKIFKDGFTENLRQVTVQAGRCWGVADAHLTPLNPPVMISAEEGGMIEDVDNGISLEIPPGAMMADPPNGISVTMLPSAQAIRDDLPQLVSAGGTFVDISGVFGDATTAPVTLRMPNQHNLPLGTQVRFGKIDHNTLEWSDLTTAFGGSGNFGIGTVVSDPVRGTAIQVQFDHFCTICTGYCLPFPSPMGPPPAPPPAPPPGPMCPQQPGPHQPGSSTVDKREGYLFEDIRLPEFRELGEPWGIRLVYFSGAAAPSVTLRGYIDYNSTRPVERTVFEFNIEGVQTSAAYAFSQNNQKHNATWLWNGRNALGDLLATGSYPYTVRATSLNANTSVAISAVYGGPATTTFNNVTYPGLTPLASNTLSERAALLNYATSPYGAGWMVAEEPRLYLDPDGCALLVENGTHAVLYSPRGGQPGAFNSPAGDFATLTRHQTTFAFSRTLDDGTVYHFTPSGLIDRIVDRYGYVTEFTHTNGRLTNLTSPTGYSYTLSYNGGRLSAITDSAGRQSTFVVEPSTGNLVSMTDAAGSTRAFSYDAHHRLIAQTGPRGERSEYDFDNGRLTETRAYDVDGTTLLRTRQFAPSAANGEAGTGLAAGQGTLQDPIPLVTERVDVYVDGRGSEWRDTTSGDGQTIAYRDPLNRTTTLAYDDNGLLVSRTRPNGSVVEFEYDADGNVTVERELADNSEVHYDYEGPFNLLSRREDALGRETLFTYAPNGNLIEVERPESAITTFEYENPALPDRVTQTIDPLGHARQVAYTPQGNTLSLTDPLLRTTLYQYDLAGNPTHITDPMQVTVVLTYDALNRTTSMFDGLNGQTVFSYSDTGCGCATSNLTSVVLPNDELLSFVYDGLNRRVSATDQLGNSSTFAYDGEGALLDKLNRNGELMTHEYDAAGQLLRTLYGDDTAYEYGYDTLGHLAFAGSAAATILQSYDARGRLEFSQTSYASDNGLTVDHAIQYDHDPAGNRSSMETEFGLTSYVYDGLDRLTTLTDPVHGAWSFVHDAVNLREIHRPNQTQTLINYDVADQITQISHGAEGSAAWLTLDYTTYDGNGSLTALARTTAAGTQSFGFGYDFLKRLAATTMPPVAGASLVSASLMFDAANRLESDGSTAYSHDFEGRRIGQQQSGSPLATTYEYDFDGRLIRIVQELDGPSPLTVLDAQYAYDGLGRRVSKSVNGVMTRYVYDGPNLLFELNSAGTIVRRYTMGLGIDRPLAISDAGGSQTWFYHADRLASVVALTDQVGAVAEEYVYDAYGAILSQSGSAGLQPLTYTAREFDAEAGLYYYRNRYYDPAVGRFITEDPLELESGDANYYAYVNNNPVNFTDPTGLNAACQACLRKAAREGTDSSIVCKCACDPTCKPPPPPKPTCNCGFIVFAFPLLLVARRYCRGARRPTPRPGASRLLISALLAVTAVVAESRAQSVNTSYDYDPVGNRTSVVNLMRVTAPQVFGAQPPMALFGERVNILGRNLPAGDAGASATFNGVAAAVISVAPNVITVEVPSGASTGPLVVTLSTGTSFDVGTFFVQGVSLTPSIAHALVGQPVQFTVEVIGAPDQTVTWQLLLPFSPGSQGLQLNPGTITPSGLYAPPPTANLNPAPIVLVKATSTALNISATATVRLFGTIATPSLVSALAPGTGQPGGLLINTIAAFPPIQVLIPDAGDVNGLPANVSAAGPPVMALVPGEGEVDGLPPNTTLAQPPLTVEIEE